MSLFKATKTCFCSTRNKLFTKGSTYEVTPCKADGEFFKRHFACLDAPDGPSAESEILKYRATLDALGVPYSTRLGKRKLKDLVDKHQAAALGLEPPKEEPEEEAAPAPAAPPKKVASPKEASGDKE